MLGRAVHYRYEGQVDVCAAHTRKLYFSLFSRFLQPLHSHFILGEVYARIALESFYKEVDNLVVEVVAAEVRVAVGCKHFENAVAYFENGYVESAAAEVVNHNLLRSFLLIQTVSESRRRGLVYYTQNV